MSQMLIWYIKDDSWKISKHYSTYVRFMHSKLLIDKSKSNYDNTCNKYDRM